MKKTQVFVAVMLSLMLIVSSFASVTKVQASYMPLEFKELTVDLSELSPEKMGSISIEEQILPNLKDKEGNPFTIEGKVLAYTYYPGSEYREYTIVNSGDTLNLITYRDTLNFEYSYQSVVEFICGEKNDQLNMDNKRYVVNIITPDQSFLKNAYIELDNGSWYEIYALNNMEPDDLLNLLVDENGEKINPEGHVLNFLRLYGTDGRRVIASERYLFDLRRSSYGYDRVNYDPGRYETYIDGRYDPVSYVLMDTGICYEVSCKLNGQVLPKYQSRCAGYPLSVSPYMTQGNEPAELFGVVYLDTNYHDVPMTLLRFMFDTDLWSEGDTVNYVIAYDRDYLIRNVPSTDTGFADYFDNVRLEAYEGTYKDVSEIPENAVDIAETVTGTNGENAAGVVVKDGNIYSPKYVTLVLYDGDKCLAVLPYIILTTKATISVEMGNYVTMDSEDESYGRALAGYPYSTISSESGYISDEDPVAGYDVTCNLNQGFSADDFYYLDMNVRKGGLQDTSYVTKAVVGDYDSLEEASEAEDIKEQLFSSNKENGGYGACYKDGIKFTVFTVDGRIWKFNVSVEEYSESKPVTPDPEPNPNPTPDPEQNQEPAPYVYFYDVYDQDGNPLRNYRISSYFDMYSDNGYETIFFTKDVVSGSAIGFTPGDKIKPVFDVYNGASVYSGQNGQSGEKQVSGQSEKVYDPDRYMLYTAVSESGKSQKNYFVSYISQQEGPKLFINGMNDSRSFVDEGDGKILYREVVFDGYNNYHDIMFANVGNQDIDQMYVRLEDAENVKLDAYWNMGETVKLSAFTTAETYMTNDEGDVYSNVFANLGKIRLVPADADSIGAVSGTLVIGYSGNGEDNEEIRIRLVGMVGNPKIVTKTVIDGVKYVPYSSLIQNNCTYPADYLTYSITDGELPEGLELKENGEIYGIPTQYFEDVEYVIAEDENYFNAEDDDKLYDKDGKLVTDKDGNYIRKATYEDEEGYRLEVCNKDGDFVRYATETHDEETGVDVVTFNSNNYSFEVTMDFEYTSRLTGETTSIKSSKSYEINIKDNDKENIEAVNNSEYGYKVLDYIDEELTLSGYGETIRSEGTFADFVRCTLDAKTLTKDVDYSAEEGSTKITVYDKTLVDAGLGEHTIAAEFRENGDENAPMKVTAQKFDIKKLAPDPTSTPEPSPTPSQGSGNSDSGNSGSGNSGSDNSGSGNSGSDNSGSGNSGSGNSGVNTTTPTSTPEPTPTPKVTKTTDSDGTVTTVTETTNTDKSKVVKTEVETKDGGKSVTTTYIDAKGNVTKTEEEKHYTNDIGTKVDTQKITKADGSVSYKAVRTRKSGNVLTKTLNTDTKGNTNITYELVKKNGKKTTTKYNVTGKGEVELVKCTTTDKSVKIGAKITVDNKSYNITSIADKAFAGNTTLEKVTIGSKISKIGTKAFYGISTLKTIYVKSKLLETVGNRAFYKISKTPKFVITANEDVFDKEKATIKDSKVAKATEWVRKDK